jgi:hypothetical protein
MNRGEEQGELLSKLMPEEAEVPAPASSKQVSNLC